MKTLSLLLSLFLTSLPLNTFAHGENKPGPHGGYIRMPGAFHTEVVKEKDGYRIYLLDINWKNPSVADSSMTASIRAGQNKTDLVCRKESNSYFCLSKSADKGELNIAAKREGQSGAAVSYQLPLNFEVPQQEMPEHMGH